MRSASILLNGKDRGHDLLVYAFACISDSAMVYSLCCAVIPFLDCFFEHDVPMTPPLLTLYVLVFLVFFSDAVRNITSSFDIDLLWSVSSVRRGWVLTKFQAYTLEFRSCIKSIFSRST